MNKRTPGAKKLQSKKKGNDKKGSIRRKRLANKKIKNYLPIQRISSISYTLVLLEL